MSGAPPGLPCLHSSLPCPLCSTVAALLRHGCCNPLDRATHGSHTEPPLCPAFRAVSRIDGIGSFRQNRFCSSSERMDDRVATVTEGVGYLAGLGWAGLGCSCICRRCCMQTQRNSPHTHAGLGRADSRSGVALNSTHPFRHCSPAAARCARAPAHSADQHMQPAPFTRNHAFTLLGCGAALEILDFFSTSRRCLLRLFVKPFVRLPGLASSASAVPTCLLPPALPRRSPPSARSCLARHFPIVVTASRAQLELRLASCMRSSSQALAHGLHWGHRSHPWSRFIPSSQPAQTPR